MIIGAWDDRKTGGPEEINIIGSHLLSFFRQSKTLHTTQFDLTLRGVTTSDTTLSNQKVKVDGITSMRDIATEDIKEFRKEFEFSLTA